MAVSPEEASAAALAWLRDNVTVEPFLPASSPAYGVSPQTHFFFAVRQGRQGMGAFPCIAVSKSTGAATYCGFIGE